MAERKINETPHVMINPQLISRELLDGIGELDPDQITVGEAKRLVLKYAMINSVNFILAGENSSGIQEKSEMFKGAAKWLGLVNKTYENDWTGLVKEVKIIGMIIEDGLIGGNEKTPGVIYKMCDIINESQKQ